MGGGTLDKDHEKIGTESNYSVVPTSSKCGGDESNGTAGDSILEQLMKLCLSEEPLSDISSTFQDLSVKTGPANGDDWETYLPEVNQIYQKVVTKIQQHESLPQQPKSEQLEKLKIFKAMLERNISFLQVSKTNILPTAPLQQGQVPQSQMQAMPQQPSQISQVQSHENPMHMSSMLQNNASNMLQNNESNMLQNTVSSMLQNILPSMLQKSVSSMVQNAVSSMLQNNLSSMLKNNMSSMQLNSLSYLPGVSASQQNINPLQPGSNLDAAQGNDLNSLQQLPVGSMQQNPVRTSQQDNVNVFFSQNGMNMLLPNNPLQENGNMLLLKQQQQQQQQQQFNQQLQDHQMQRNELIQNSKSRLQSMRLRSIFQIMAPLNPFTSNPVGDSNKFPEPGAQSGHSNGGDWRSQMQAGSRQRIVDKMMETLKRLLSLYGQEDLQRIATGYEEIFYSAALSQSDYLRTISLKMLTVERLSPPVLLPFPRSPVLGAPLDSNEDDWKEEVYQKIKTMKETYLPELNQMLQGIVTKLEQPMSDQVDKLETLKTMLERLVSVLQVSKTNILPCNKQWLGLYEWRIIHLLAIKPDLLTNPQILRQITPFLAIQPDVVTNSLNLQVLNQSVQDRLMNLSTAKRSREKQLEQEVKKQKVEIKKLKQALKQQVKEEKE